MTEIGGYTQNDAISWLQGQLGRVMSDRSFNRWRRAANVEKKGSYTHTQVKMILVIGEYLAEDRNIPRAQQRLNYLMENAS